MNELGGILFTSKVLVKTDQTKVMFKHRGYSGYKLAILIANAFPFDRIIFQYKMRGLRIWFEGNKKADWERFVAILPQ